MIRSIAKVGRPMITTMDRMTNSGELVISKQKVRSNKDRKTKNHKLWYKTRSGEQGIGKQKE